MDRFSTYQQLDQMDCGPTCLRMITKHYGRTLSIESLREQCSLTNQGVSLGGICEAAEAIGFNTAGVQVKLDVLKDEVPLPCIAHWRQRHFVVVYKITPNHVYVADPAFGKVRHTHNEFCDGWLNRKDPNTTAGALLLLEPTPAFYESQDEELKESGKGLGLLWPYFRPYLRLWTQLIAGLLVASLALVCFPFITQTLVDQGVNTQNLNLIYLLLAAQLMLFFSQTTVDLLRSWILLYVGSRINISLISDFLIKLMKLPIAFFDSKTIGDLLQRVQDHDRIESFLSSSTIGVLFSLLSVFVFSVILAWFSPLIFMIFIGGTTLYIVWIALFMKRRKVLDYKRFDQASGNQSSMVQLLNGMQEIKLNNSERRRRWEWERIQVKLYKISVKSLALFQYQAIGGNFINELKNIIITFVAAKAVLDGSITLGTMLAIQYIIGQLNSPINNFMGFIQSLQDARLSLTRLSEIHDQKNESENAVNYLPEQRDIAFRNKVSFRYGNGFSPNILEDIELTIPAGKITAIVGPSGSGKTTLLKMLLKFYTPQQGQICVGSTNLEDVSTRLWRNQCGVVMQDGYIFSDTILRNITESDSDTQIDRQRLREALRISNLVDLVESMPGGLNTRIGASGLTLSGGQRQRILIARAVYKNPQYLFFDEATSSLDARNEREVMEHLKAFFLGRTVLIIAHRLSTVRDADQIITLDRARIVECGNHQTLIKQKGAYFTLIKNQLELG